MNKNNFPEIYNQFSDFLITIKFSLKDISSKAEIYLIEEVLISLCLTL